MWKFLLPIHSNSMWSLFRSEKEPRPPLRVFKALCSVLNESRVKPIWFDLKVKCNPVRLHRLKNAKLNLPLDVFICLKKPWCNFEENITTFAKYANILPYSQRLHQLISLSVSPSVNPHISCVLKQKHDLFLILTEWNLCVNITRT